MTEEAVKGFGKNVPMKRPGQPAELATAYVMLADPLSSYVSGATNCRDRRQADPVSLYFWRRAILPFRARRGAFATLSPVTRCDSTDGGNTWTPMGTTELSGMSVIGVAARGSTILAATFENKDPHQHQLELWSLWQYQRRLPLLAELFFAAGVW
jgi:hypothetical protein